MQAILWPIVNWIFRNVIVKFVILTCVYLVVTLLLPMMLSILSPYLGVDVLTNAFTSLPPMTWYFLDMFRLDVGLPVMLSLGVTLFVLRRVPFLNVK